MSETPSVEDRITLLEEQNEALKRSGLLLVILVVLMGATMIYTSRSAAGAVSTDGVILNNLGRPKVAISTMPNGHVGALFYDFNGNLPPEVKFKAIPYLDGIALYDRNGNPRILLGMDDKDNPIMAVVSPEGKTLFNAVAPEGAPAQEAPAEEAPASTPTPAATP